MERINAFEGHVPSGWEVNYWGFLERPFFPEHRHRGSWKVRKRTPLPQRRP